MKFPILVLAAALGVLAGAGGYTMVIGEAAAYLGNDPEVCVNCHVMRDVYDGWRKGGHHAAAVCNDCHVPQGLVPKYLSKADNGYRHSRAFTLQDFHEPIRITPRNAGILQDNCRRCHRELVEEIAGHAGAPDCVRCHGDVGHGPTR